jgi:FkbM family methyltransferase
MMNSAGCISRTRTLNRLPQLTVIPMGLANSSELAMESLYTTRGMIDSTLESAEAFKETFLVSRLDWLWPRISGGNPQIDGVKIDVQGMEIQVLEGMAEMLKRRRPKLLVEIHKGVSRPQLLDLIASLGYAPRGIAVEALPGESDPAYANDRTYLFSPASANGNPA